MTPALPSKQSQIAAAHNKAASEARLWVLGQTSRSKWHAATKRPSDYGGTDQFIKACDGKAMYSPYGVTNMTCDRPSEIEHGVCPRCEAALAKAQP